MIRITMPAALSTRVYIAFYSLIILRITLRMLSYGKSFRKQNRASLYATILLVFIGIGMQELLIAAPAHAFALLCLSTGRFSHQ